MMQVEEAITYVNWMEAQKLLNHKEYEYCTHNRANKYDGIWYNSKGQFVAYAITCLDCHSSGTFNSDKPVPVVSNLEQACIDYNNRNKSQS